MTRPPSSPSQAQTSTHPSAGPGPSRPSSAFGVRIIGTGSALPSRTLTNADLEKMMDTSDEWIVQRTGVRTRKIIDAARGESTMTLSADSLKTALAAANLAAKDLDLVICATMTPEMPCPPVACRVADMVGAGDAGAFDLNGACCGYVFALNTAHDLIKGGAYKTIAVIGADCISTMLDYTNAGRSTSIIFGDAAATAIMRADPDTSKGIIAQAMHADGGGWKHIYVPISQRDFPTGAEFDPSKCNRVQMNGATVFKFAVGTFPGLIQETLDKAGLKADDVDMFICHQSNARILQAARERFGLSTDRLYVNIERYGNTLAASVPLCLDELVKAGRVKAGQKVMFVAFGAGLTWGSSLWQL